MPDTIITQNSTPEQFAQVCQEALSSGDMKQMDSILRSIADNWPCSRLVTSEQKISLASCLKERINVETQSDLPNDKTLAELYRLLGVCQQYGIGMERNVSDAVTSYRWAADKGNKDAQAVLAVCYFKGQGVTENRKEAVRLSSLAANQGHVAAQVNLGKCYQHGIGVAKDEREAVRLYQLAANQGDKNAQVALANCYRHGIGIAKDEPEAVRLYHLAANQGDKNAQVALGVFYFEGRGVTKDPKEAVRFLRLAAAQGHAVAQCNLAFCYRDGTGVKRNRLEALKYFVSASDKGDDNALNMLKTVMQEYVPKEVIDFLNSQMTEHNSASSTLALAYLELYRSTGSTPIALANKAKELAADQPLEIKVKITVRANRIIEKCTEKLASKGIAIPVNIAENKPAVEATASASGDGSRWADFTDGAMEVGAAQQAEVGYQAAAASADERADFEEPDLHLSDANERTALLPNNRGKR